MAEAYRAAAVSMKMDSLTRVQICTSTWKNYFSVAWTYNVEKVARVFSTTSQATIPKLTTRSSFDLMNGIRGRATTARGGRSTECFVRNLLCSQRW
eukprot:1162036-Karenia_brevis.AAC.1